ncbi:MAG: hypothetical protein M3214_10380 [Actinomycetota bacterium]|nr:hypothetical protein [Actinomycetota bacterium]
MRSRTARRAFASAARYVDAPIGYDQRDVTRLEDSAWVGDIRAVAIPERRSELRDLLFAARLPHVATDKHRPVLEQLGQRRTVPGHERVL